MGLIYVTYSGTSKGLGPWGNSNDSTEIVPTKWIGLVITTKVKLIGINLSRASSLAER